MTKSHPLPATDTLGLFSWADVILVNTSGGKDSQTMMDEVHRLATAAGFTDKLIAAHCDLGRAEWEDTPELAEEQSGHYGIRFEKVSRELGDLLDQIADRRVSLDSKSDRLYAAADEAAGNMTDALSAAVVLALRFKARESYEAAAFPSSDARYCTSDQKTSQVKKLITRLIEEFGVAGKLGPPTGFTKKGEPVYRALRVLNCLGMRAAESTKRAKYTPLEWEVANTKREVVRWLPIFDWSDDEVWARIAETGVRYHWAYDLGMSRLSCAFCVFASKADLKISARRNRKLAEDYVALEDLTRSRFTHNLSMAEVLAEVDAEDAAGTATPIPFGRKIARRIPVSVMAA